ncbi:NAD-dependent protein deacetylase sirtuin-7 [Hypsibius exemplaris]|uniref:protein acetyllysine N-acetyltransferase n=1 Tax=Hypsibius exemplaris TaxID=2072580 RepID=A0A9X6NQ85_HYPEX|nr:NAD-dependent protein deacetylase sirtuin-7 [Hypsibius exemplaris]
MAQPQPISDRERRKAEQVSAILEREEKRQIRLQACQIAAKTPESRTAEDLQFIQQHRRLVEKAERQNREVVLDEQRKLEIFDSDAEIEEKCRILANALRSAKHTIVYTGAGISTAADIPDYRGPNGLWTRSEKGESCVDPLKPFDLTKAKPTFTHMALLKLHEAGLLKYIVSQNCDGLHVRSGFPRSSLSEVHGNMYLEMCGNCEPEREYFRSFDVTTKTRWRRHRTGRKCHRCGVDLEDTIVLFGEKSRTAVPMNWEMAQDHSKLADVVLCLGSSLKVLKDYPCLWHRRQKLYIVNLQWTPKDESCHLKLHARCDDVMQRVMALLNLIPDTFLLEKDTLTKIVVPLRRRELTNSSDQTPSSAEVAHQPGWLGQGVKGLIKRSKEESSPSGRKRKKRKSEAALP